jgi:hypothetical protein
MTNQEKAILYDELIRESDKLQRINSKYKSDYVTNIPENIQQEIDKNNERLSLLVNRLEALLR